MADNLTLALDGAFNQEQPGAADSMTMAVKDARPLPANLRGRSVEFAASDANGRQLRYRLQTLDQTVEASSVLSASPW